MTQHELNPAGWAKSAGLSNANAIYNFLSGHSRSLSQRVLEKLTRVVPGASMLDLMGTGPDLGATANVPLLTVRSTAEVGAWRGTYESGAARGATIQIAVPPRVPADEAVQILDDHCDLIYPRNSCVCIQALMSLNRQLRDGDMVLLDAINEQRQHEVTIRRVTAREDGGFGLTFAASSVPLYQAAVDLPQPYEGQMLTIRAGVRAQIRGRVSMMVIVDLPGQ
jgi:hypothetical protein